MKNVIDQDIQQQVLSAYNNNQRLKIIGGNSKAFYGNTISGDKLIVSEHCGVISYEPTELVITARAGTTLDEMTRLLEEENQILGFEPPSFSTKKHRATIGGTIACNFSGPRRASAGAARDFLLGCKIINGKAEKMTFGGKVMKNVAGYDVSRLMAGAMGTLGVILECSIKTLPKPESEITLCLQVNETDALQRMRNWARKPLPISATCYYDSQLFFRLSGTENATKAALKKIGGEILKNDTQFWQSIREQQHDFFQNDTALWRLSVDPTAPALLTTGKKANYSSLCLYEWGGSLRWIHAEEDNTSIRDFANQYGGHATLFKHSAKGNTIFHPLTSGLSGIHKNIKKAFDPKGILNFGKMYSDL